MSATNAAVKNFAEIPSDTEKDLNITFTAEESWYLVKEFIKQIKENGSVNLDRAINNARYLAKLDRSIQQFKEGKVVSFTDEEWEKFVNEQELHG